ncbi:MAG: agmatine deiminase family protein [Chloroflexota bacterium]
MNAQGSNQFLQFNYIPYPLWRRKLPLPLKWAARPLLQRYYPVKATGRTVPTVNDIADYLLRFDLLPGINRTELTKKLAQDYIGPTEIVDPDAQPATTTKPSRLPAQWEPIERVMMSWPVLYPPLWPLHAQMAEAISAVASVQINVPHYLWQHAIHLYLEQRGKAIMNALHFYHLPTDDIWIRDYGPVVCLDENGQRVAVNMTYDPLPNYPQHQDDSMPRRWAAHRNFPVYKLDFHGEGGNLWSDGMGTLLMTNQAYRQNEDLNRISLLERLHGAFTFEKLVILPRLRMEETGHVDLVVKLASADTVLVSGPQALFTGDRLRMAANQLRRDTNARGDRYNVVMLPTPPLYFNWFGYPIRRSYTNALTVNGRVLVPVYGIPTDERALHIYADTMPDHDIVPIDCTIGANGGGAVHCLTKEVPQLQPAP